MTELALAPMQWSKLDDIDDVEPVGENDTDCLSEIRDVLRKYGMMKRFGVALLHSHFDVANDEIMLETNDPESRTLLTRPVKMDGQSAENIGTVFMLREGDVITTAWCKSYCKRQFFGHGSGHRSL